MVSLNTHYLSLAHLLLFSRMSCLQAIAGIDRESSEAGFIPGGRREGSSLHGEHTSKEPGASRQKHVSFGSADGVNMQAATSPRSSE